MMDDCRHCGSGRVVPVLDSRMIGQPHGGNPYRTRCLNCSRWLTMTSKDTFKSHLRPHVLPKDADPETEGSTIPLEDWDRSEQYQELVDRLKSYQERERIYGTVADAGEEGDEEEVDDQPANDEETNRFECPACGQEVTGYPDDCPHCGHPYKW